MRWSKCVAGAVTFATALAAGGVAAAAEFRSSGTGLSFGTYDPGQAAETRASTTITLTCQRDCPAVVAIALGEGGDGGKGRIRRMSKTAGEDALEYVLFLRGGTGADDRIELPVSPAVPVSFRVELELPAGQNVSQGEYRDRVRVRIEW